MGLSLLVLALAILEPALRGCLLVHISSRTYLEKSSNSSGGNSEKGADMLLSHIVIPAAVGR